MKILTGPPFFCKEINMLKWNEKIVLFKPMRTARERKLERKRINQCLIEDGGLPLPEYRTSLKRKKTSRR